VEIGGAHQSSYGREAAAVFAAAVAAAMTPGLSVDGVFDAVLGLARDGTRDAIEAVLQAAGNVDSGDWSAAIPVLRDAVRPFDSVGETYREPAQDSRRPSRLRAIEELPVALGFLAVTGGDVRGSILGATNYGRDSDSIATMGGAIAGALGGQAAVPADWAETVATASKLDLHSGGRTMAAIAREIHAADRQAFERRSAALDSLTVAAPGTDTPGTGTESSDRTDSQ
jgi:ADP-ribosylglycohydrolase